MTKIILNVLVIVILLQGQLYAQAIYEDERYVEETDPLVLEKIDQWQDKKFGLLTNY